MMTLQEAATIIIKNQDCIDKSAADLCNIECVECPLNVTLDEIQEACTTMLEYLRSLQYVTD